MRSNHRSNLRSNHRSNQRSNLRSNLRLNVRSSLRMLSLRSNLRSNQATNLSLNLRSNLRSKLRSNQRSNLRSNGRLNLGPHRGWYFRVAILIKFLSRHEVNRTIIIINIFLGLWICKCRYKTYDKIGSCNLGSLCGKTAVCPEYSIHINVAGICKEIWQH